jgi:hypothetical protein
MGAGSRPKTPVAEGEPVGFSRRVEPAGMLRIISFIFNIPSIIMGPTEMNKRTIITGIAHYVPPRVITNFDLEKLMDTSDEWIRQT